jgi:hypothetical protein
MITVTGPLWLWPGDGATWHFVTIPAELSGEIRAHAFGSPRGFGSVRVVARLHDVIWRTSVFPMKSGGYILPVKAEVRRKADVAAGDDVTVALDLL